MRLIAAHVSRYRNILDSTKVEFQPDVTCLVGKNESGKTAFLHALYRLNPARPNVSFNQQREYPAWLQKKHRMQGLDLDAVVPATVHFRLDDTDRALSEEKFGPGAFVSDEIKVSRNYKNVQVISFQVDEAVCVANLVNEVDLTEEARRLASDLKTLASVQSLATDLKGRKEPDSEPQRAAGAALERAVSDFLAGAAEFRAAVTKFVDGRLPRFFYFDDYSSLPGIVKIKQLIEADPAKLDDDELTALSLLQLAGAEDDYLLNPEYETRKRELENVANAITDEVLKYWSTNPELRVDIDITKITENVAKGQQAVLDELHVRLYDNRHLLSLPFSERSTGFRWFFSFLAAFSKYLYNDEPVIILLDEPGLGLHARAQKDFLRFIDERLAGRCQVIYSTHSPFMVQPGKLERARVVEDRGRETGSVISSDVLTTDPDTLFPLQGALGYDLAQHLLIGANNLVIEGTSDFAYLTVLSDHLVSLGRTGLDSRWSTVPVGGADMIPTFVALLGTHLDLTVLIDSRREGNQRLSHLAEKGYLSATRIIALGEVLNRKQADTEDLFVTDDYLALYNSAFGKNIKSSDLKGTDSIVNQIARHEGVDRIDHGRPADALLRNKVDVLPKLSPQTLANFEALFARVNQTLGQKAK